MQKLAPAKLIESTKKYPCGVKDEDLSSFLCSSCQVGFITKQEVIISTPVRQWHCVNTLLKNVLFSMQIMIFIYIEFLLLSTGHMNIPNVEIQIRIFFEIKWRHFLLQYPGISSPYIRGLSYVLINFEYQRIFKSFLETL